MTSLLNIAPALRTPKASSSWAKLRSAARLPHRETTQSAHRQDLCLDREIHGGGQSLLLLLPRSRLWTFLPRVLFLLPLQCAKLCLNEHEYTKCQLARQNIRYEALDNGILSYASLTGCKPSSTISRQQRSMPYFASGCACCLIPSRPAIEAGYRYQLSILQIELSLTQVLDRPSVGAFSSKRSSGRTSIPAVPNRCNSSLFAG
jgi:hypothetical protein